MALTLTLTNADDGAAKLSVVGEIDVSCASELRDAVNDLLVEDGSPVEVDLAEVPYIDSTGIGVLVCAAHRAAEAGQAFAVTNPQRNVRRVLDMLGISQELGIDGADA